MATCGKCKEQNVSIQHVRECFGVESYTPKTEKDVGFFSDDPFADEPFPGDEPEAEVTDKPVEKVRFDLRVPFDDKDEAKKELGAKWDPKNRVWYTMQPEGWTSPEKWDPGRVLEDGIYQYDDTFWMVYHSHYGRWDGQQVAKELVLTDEKRSPEDPIGEWKARGQAPLSKLFSTDRLNDEQAAEFGQIYGWCGRCGRVLTNEESKAAGIGPVCAGKE